MEVGFTKDLVEVPADERFVAYAGGFATALLARLDAGEQLSQTELNWLYTNDPDSYKRFDIRRICRVLIDRYTLLRITQRFKE